MPVNTTDYSQLEDAVKSTIMASLSKTAGGYIPDASIQLYDGDVSLEEPSFAEWAKGPHGPKVMIAIEGIVDDEFVADGGRHPRRTWQNVTVALYLYDESLRGNRTEDRRGMSGVDNAPGIYKLINDVRATLAGYVAAVHTLKWEGPFFNDALLKEKKQGQQLWRMEAIYRGCVENSIDTSTLDAFTSVDADLNREGDLTDIAVEALVTIP
jgi:hypothetical protein